MKSLAVLIWHGGQGSNLISIAKAIQEGRLTAGISVVVCGKDQGNGVIYARENSLELSVQPDREQLSDYIIQEVNPDYIVLAGWKRIISDRLIDAFPNRILNLHPGLIPDSLDGVVLAPDGSRALWNRGLYGTKAVEQFLRQGCTYAGSSVSFLTHEFDFGPVLKRGFVSVLPEDSVETLYPRLKQKENEIYVESLIELFGM